MAEILLYGPIGQDLWEPENSITAKQVMDQLAGIDSDVTVRISSGGGDVYEGIDIMTALQNHPGKVTVIVESLAASAASFIAVGGADEVLMRESSEMMIHRAWTFMDGNADDMRKTLADLERQDMKLANIYAGKAGGEIDQWLEAMSAETWYTAEEAVAAGLADGIVNAKKTTPAKTPVAASLRRRFKFANRAAAPPPVIPRHADGEEKTEPSNGQKGEEMNFLAQLAQAMGMKEDEVRAGLASIRNEEIEVATVVTAEYPDEVTVVPTGSVQVDPTDPLPEEVEVTAEIGDGFTCEVGAGGIVTVRASDEVSVGDTAELGITAGDSSCTVAVTVVAADEEEEPEEVAPEVPGVAGETPEHDATPVAGLDGGIPEGFTLVPTAHLEDLTARAQMGDEAYNAKVEADLEEEVDNWIAEGRFAAGRRDAVLASMRTDAELTRKTWGALPANSIPRVEAGYGTDPEAATSRVAGASPFPSVRI